MGRLCLCFYLQEGTMTALTLAIALISYAHADDWDMDMEIDLGGADAKGQEMVTYQGDTSKTAPEYVAGSPVSIAHKGGNITVNCVDREGISARATYTLEGTNRDALKRFGDGVGLKAWGGARGGGVQTRIPGASSSIKRKDVPLVITLPKSVKLKISGGTGWIQVNGCEGPVAAANRSGDIVLSGKLSSASATAPKGDVTVTIDESAQMSGSSKVSASGSATLTIPSDYGGKLSVRGSSVKVRHLVDGTETDTLVQGTVGDGNASLTVTAKGAVDVKAAN